MGRVVECAVLCQSQTDPVLTGLRSRLREQDSVGLQAELWPAALNAESMAGLQWRLQRYDLAIGSVTVSELPVMRQRLSLRPAGAHPPLLLLTHQLKAVAIADLLRLGVQEFVDSQASPDELLIRLRRCARGPAAQSPQAPSGGDLALPPYVGEGLPFQAAKQRLIRDFEQRYLHESLRAHQGNVSQAARSARKNRRAFWALMSRHRISAAPYRSLVDAAEPRAGEALQ